jgi:hypothetical protein
MAKERHRAQSEAAPGYKTDQIKSQKSMIFVKKFAGEGCRGLLN